MIIQFSDVAVLDLSVARLCVFLAQSDPDKLNDNSTIASAIGVTCDTLANNQAMRDCVSEWRHRSRSFRTPISDWDVVPFLLTEDEKPVSGANAWLRQISKSRSPKTSRTYAYGLYDFFQYLEAQGIDWENVSDDTLFSYRRCQEVLVSQHKRKHNGNRGLAKNTIQMRIIVVGEFYKYATRAGFIETNPLTYELVEYRRPSHSNFLSHLGKKPEKEIPIAAYRHLAKRKEPKALPHERIWEWITSIPNERNRLIAMLLYQTGMRREEILLWRTTDIPCARNEEEVSEWVQFEIRGKGGKRRLIRISSGMFRRLRDWLDFNRPRILEKRGITKEADHGFVWIAERTGHPLQPISLNHIFTRISVRCGIQITPHMLRHSFAMQKRTELYKDGIPNPDKLLSVLLGHSSLVTTTSIYGEISPDELAREADLNALLLAKLLPGN